MKVFKLLILLCCLSLIFLYCNKEPYYPNSIIGTWRFLGTSSSKDKLPTIKIEKNAYLRITSDSLLFFDGSFENCISKVKIELDDDYFVDNGGFPRKITYFQSYIIDSVNIGYIQWSSEYWIIKDILVKHSIDMMDSGFFGFYQFIPID
jgi:hypothetical protein